MATVDCIFSSQSAGHPQVTPREISSTRRSALTYRQSAFHSTYLRLTSMEKRMANLIQLSFNLVAQQDSRSFKIDNKLMMLIAVLTLVFLPTSTIASIFGTQFFAFNQQQQQNPTSGNGSVSQSASDLLVSHQFWIFWVCVAAATLGMCCMSWVYFHRMRSVVMGARQPKRTGTGLSELLGGIV